MKPLRLLVGLLFLILLAAVAVFAVRVSRHYSSARAEISQFKITQLDDATRTRLKSLKDNVFLTYFASPRDVMPSHMRDIEQSVHDLFETLKRESNGLLDYQIVDPGRSEDLERYAANRKISRIRARSVSRDSYSEKTIWSGISIAYGAHSPAIINGIEYPEHLERLQALITGHLNQMETPRLPVIALAAPSGGAQYKEMVAALTEPDKTTKKVRAKVIQFNFEPGARIPDEADVLFWMEPGKADPRQIRELNFFLESGRCAVVAGAELAGEPVGTADGVNLTVKTTQNDLEPLLSEFGLHPVKDFVLDTSCGELVGGANNEKIPAPFLHRVIGYCQDFRTMRGQPNGTLLFVTPTCFTLDAERLAERRWTADLLVTTSDKSWVTNVPAGTVNLKDLVPSKGEPVAKQVLMVGLRHDSPFHGSVVFAGANTPFVDGRFGYSQEGTAHWKLLRVLVDSLASDERLVQAQAGLGRFAPIPELTSGQKLWWRALALLLIPGGLVIVAFSRGIFRFGTAEEKRLRTGPGAGFVLATRGALALAVIVALGAGSRALAMRVDLTEEKINILSAPARDIAQKATAETKVQLYFSSHDHLPPAMRPLVGRVRDTLREMRRAGANLNVEYIETDELAANERAALQQAGISPTKVTIRDEESTVTKVVFSAVRISRGGKTETLQFPTLSSFENVEFRLAFALWRLESGRRPHVAFASDIPRLTPAEDWDFQQQQQLAPKGADVYSVAREILKNNDFRVTHVNPREPAIPDDVDLLIWLQPRRDVSKMFEEVSKYLHRGGKVILAAQHFNMQSRQYRGGERRFDFVYWPQPQFNDVDNMYFPDIGIRMVNEVLFDDLKTRFVLDAQVFRSAIKEYRPMESALPFAIRAAAANFATDSLITKSLDDQALLFSSFFDWDEARLKELGIVAKPLMFTSAHSWAYAWKGGWIPKELLDWPPKEPRAEAANPMMGPKGDSWRLAPRVPLAVLFEGNFPESGPLSIQMMFPGMTGSAPESRSTRPETRPQPAGSPGKLLMIGCSEVFKNYRILEREFRGDHFLLNSVSALGLETGLATIATRRPVARGFEIQDSETRAGWRTFVVFAMPALLALFGAIYSIQRATGAVRRVA